jgi:hypothetical protein
MKERGQGRPEGAPKEEDRTHQKERGGGEKESKEHQSAPSVWDLLERHVRLNTKDVEGHPKGKEHDLQQHEVNWLIYDLKTKKGASRDKLIIGLFNSITIQPGEYGPSDRDLSLEEFQQLRSKVEPLAEEEIREEIRSVNEEYNRQWKEYNNLHKSKNPRLMPRLACWQPSLRDRFRAQDIDDSDN